MKPEIERIRFTRVWRCLCGLVILACVLASGPRAHAITPNSQETDLATLITTDPGQQRPSMTYHPILNLVARAKAQDMATRNYFSHVDPDGYGPNYVVEMAEYALPDWWGDYKDTNYVESAAAGYSTASATFTEWMDSPGHKQHVLGEIQFYREQIYYGVGYAYNFNSTYRHYWIFLSAPPDPAATLAAYIEWLFDRLLPAQVEHPQHDPDEDGIKTVLEYALDFDPASRTTNACFELEYNDSLGRGEMTVPLRPDLDPDVAAFVETTTNLIGAVWNTNDVTRVSDTFSAGSPSDQARFLRLKVQRP